jgi:hypothetical protein
MDTHTPGQQASVRPAPRRGPAPPRTPSVPVRPDPPRPPNQPRNPAAGTGQGFLVAPDDLLRAASSYSAEWAALRAAAPLSEEPEPRDFHSPIAATATRDYYLDARRRLATFEADAAAFVGNLTEAARAYTDQDEEIARSLTASTAPTPCTPAIVAGALGTLFTGGTPRPGLPTGAGTTNPDTAGPPRNPAPPPAGSPEAMLNPYIHTPGLIDRILNQWYYTPATRATGPGNTGGTPEQAH